MATGRRRRAVAQFAYELQYLSAEIRIRPAPPHSTVDCYLRFPHFLRQVHPFPSASGRDAAGGPPTAGQGADDQRTFSHKVFLDRWLPVRVLSGSTLPFEQVRSGTSTDVSYSASKVSDSRNRNPPSSLVVGIGYHEFSYQHHVGTMIASQPQADAESNGSLGLGTGILLSPSLDSLEKNSTASSVSVLSATSVLASNPTTSPSSLTSRTNLLDVVYHFWSLRQMPEHKLLAAFESPIREIERLSLRVGRALFDELREKVYDPSGLSIAMGSMTLPALYRYALEICCGGLGVAGKAPRRIAHHIASKEPSPKKALGVRHTGMTGALAAARDPFDFLVVLVPDYEKIEAVGSKRGGCAEYVDVVPVSGPRRGRNENRNCEMVLKRRRKGDGPRNDAIRLLPPDLLRGCFIVPRKELGFPCPEKTYWYPPDLQGSTVLETRKAAQVGKFSGPYSVEIMMRIMLPPRSMCRALLSAGHMEGGGMVTIFRAEMAFVSLPGAMVGEPLAIRSRWRAREPSRREPRG